MFIFRVDDDLVLRLPEENDAGALLALFQRDRDYFAYWNDWPKRMQTIEACQAFVVQHRRSYAEEKAIPAAMIYKGQFAGIISLDIQERYVVKKGELSYWISEVFQGKGLVTRSCQALLAYAFAELGLNRISLRFKHVSADNENSKSRRVAERLGFTQEGVQRQGGAARGQFMDMVVYSLLAEEWQARQKPPDGVA
ncbi:MAG: GNAT family N-acetyltransferase [Anaerolineales bacterium]|nr:GNAT family N-acetyltransferase [Anaerolineales bacterium]MCB8990394.1 GNAT family N-acetyltransferase [Ardenticatenaceae bacterium]MCB9003408.1 GNAT family N-acetyltransferase [Ardenticatenaceae bacterium]